MCLEKNPFGISVDQAFATTRYRINAPYILESNPH